MKNPPNFLQGGGEMGRRMRAFDWAAHPLGPPEAWPRSLKTVIQIILTSRFAMWMGWGPDLIFFCNDAYLPTTGMKSGWVLGAPAKEVWAEIWPDIGPRIEAVMQRGEATWDESLPLFLERSGFTEETYHTFSYSPAPNDDGSVGGLLCVVTEDTERVIGQRRLGRWPRISPRQSRRPSSSRGCSGNWSSARRICLSRWRIFSMAITSRPNSPSPMALRRAARSRP